MTSSEWLAEDFAINGLFKDLKVSAKVYRRRGIVWGTYRQNYYNRYKDNAFDSYQKEIGQYYDYNYSDLPQYMLKCPCVYILYNNEEIVYVGQTKWLSGRIGGHLHKEYNYAQIIHCADFGLRSKIEQFLIETYTPVYNRAHNPLPLIKPLILVSYEKEFLFICGKDKRWYNYKSRELLKYREKYGILQTLQVAK